LPNAKIASKSSILYVKQTEVLLSRIWDQERGQGTRTCKLRIYQHRQATGLSNTNGDDHIIVLFLYYYVALVVKLLKYLNLVCRIVGLIPLNRRCLPTDRCMDPAASCYSGLCLCRTTHYEFNNTCSTCRLSSSLLLLSLTQKSLIVYTVCTFVCLSVCLSASRIPMKSNR